MGSLLQPRVTERWRRRHLVLVNRTPWRWCQLILAVGWRQFLIAVRWQHAFPATANRWRPNPKKIIGFSDYRDNLLPRISQYLSTFHISHVEEVPYSQRCGSMTFWGGSGSGSADPCLWLVDPNPDSDPDSNPDPGSGSCYFRHWSYVYTIFQR